MLDLPALVEPFLVLPLADPMPEPDEVKAGWVAFGIWMLMAVAVGLLGYSLVRQLRKAQRAKDAGVYGDAPQAPEQAGQTDQTGQTDQAGQTDQTGQTGQTGQEEDGPQDGRG